MKIKFIGGIVDNKMIDIQKDPLPDFIFIENKDEEVNIDENTSVIIRGKRQEYLLRIIRLEKYPDHQFKRYISTRRLV